AILQAYIQICRQLRIQGIDDGDVDFSVFHGLPQVIQKDRHIFNIWREELGGLTPKLDESDKVVYLLSKLALEIYPLFLIKTSVAGRLFSHTYFHISSSLYKLPEQNVLFKEIINDTSLKKMFSNIGKNEIDTTGYFMASSGRGGDLQLAGLPSTIITTAYELMRLRGELSQESLISSITKVVEIMRSVAEGELVQVPVFVGFHNVGFDGFDSLDTDWGLLRSYNEGVLELIPPTVKPSTGGSSNHILGFVLESKYPYKVDFNVVTESKSWPPELNQARDHLVNLQENLGLTFTIAIERTPPVGITPAWTLIVDPLSSGTTISWNPRLNSPVSFYICNVNDKNSIRKWCSTINNIEDSKIRIAIRRILSSINERMNPIDGFVDSVIAWENLFGGNAELSFRISSAIARLLKDDEESRHALQKKIVDFYNDRSKIVHGVKEITHEEAVNKRNECLGIALSCLRALYRTKPELISDPERAKKLILQ
ncbi:MAG: hypothetical protein HY097_10015, partial [Nitrospinae bacterium]|nr:hypothetical protein [Nitrospinota bacterium]